MSIFNFNKITTENSQNVAATIGDRNVISISQEISKVDRTDITNDVAKWSDVIDQITELQKLLKEIPDENENVRDQELLPQASKAKSQAGDLTKSPEAEKQGFHTLCNLFVSP